LKPTLERKSDSSVDTSIKYRVFMAVICTKKRYKLDHKTKLFVRPAEVKVLLNELLNGITCETNDVKLDPNNTNTIERRSAQASSILYVWNAEWLIWLFLGFSNMITAV
jgi:hypothetical protein